MDVKKNKGNGFAIGLGLIIVIIGIALIIGGVIIRMPGGALTTYESLDGVETDGYAFDDNYSSIDEYVGGDAYNYIIGAALVSGRISGAMTSKAIYIVGGIICICIGFAVISIRKKDKILQEVSNDNAESKMEINYMESKSNVQNEK